MANEVLISIIGDATSIQRAGRVTRRELDGISQSASRASRSTSQLGSGFATLFRVSSRVNVGLDMMGRGLRMVGQSLLNVGITASYFISLPLERTIRGAVGAAIDLNDELVRVQKTTGLAGDAMSALTSSSGLTQDSIEVMRKRLIDFAKTVPTPIQDLYAMAEVIGQLGFRSVKDIMALVKAGNMMGVATDLSARDATYALGRLAIMYGKTGDAAIDWARRAGSAINVLENTTAASASQIVDALLSAGSAAQQFGVTLPDIAAVAASLVSAGLSSQEAGTVIRRGFENITQNLDKVSKLTGRSVADLQKYLNGPNGVLGLYMSLIKSIREIPDAYARTVAYEQIFEVRGTRGAARLAKSYDYLVQAQVNAREEFKTGTALQAEYNRALSSTASQLSILKNNLVVAASVIGDALLPVINKFVSVAVPGIQMILDYWSKLPDRTKRLAIALAALPAVLFPLLTTFGSLMFAIGIGSTGIMTLIRGFLVLTAGMRPAISALSTFVTLLSILTMIFGRDLARLFRSVASIFKDTAKQARGWGYGIISSLAAGLLDGVAIVIDAAASVAEAIAKFFRSASPPKYGPLRGILKWGTSLVNTYLEGFKSADFSIIEDIGSTIRDIFQRLADAAGKPFSAMVPYVLSARTALVKLIDAFNRTGKVSQDLLNQVTSKMGGAKGAVSDLIKAYLEYYRIQKQIDDLDRKRKDVTKTYDDQIKAVNRLGNISATERARRIAIIKQQKAAALKAVDDEESSLRDQSKVAQEQLDKQRGIVNYHMTTDDLLSQQAKAMNSIARSAGRIGKALGSGIGKFKLGLVDINKQAAQFTSNAVKVKNSVNEVAKRFQEGRRAIYLFIYALKGVNMDAIIDQEGRFTDLQKRAYREGKRIHDTIDHIRDVFHKTTAPVGKASGAFLRLITILRLATRGSGLKELRDMFGDLSPAELSAAKAGKILRDAVVTIRAGLIGLIGPGSIVADVVSDVYKALKSFIKGLTGSDKDLDRSSGLMRAAYNIGAKLADVFRNIKDRVDKAGGISGIFEKAKKYAPGFLKTLLGISIAFDLMRSTLGQIARVIGLIFAGATAGNVARFARTLLGFGQTGEAVFATLLGLAGKIRVSFGALGRIATVLPVKYFAGLASLIIKIVMGFTSLGGTAARVASPLLRFGGILTKVFGAVLGPLTSVGITLGVVAVTAVAVAAAVAGAAVWIGKNIDLVKAKVKAFEGRFLAAAGGADALKDRLNRLYESLKVVFNGIALIGAAIAKLITYALPGLGTAFGGAVNVILSALELVVNGVADIINIIGAVITALKTGDWSGVKDALAKAWQDIIQSVSGIVKGGIDIIMGLIGGLATGIAGLLGIDPKPIQESIDNIASILKSNVDMILSWYSSLAESVAKSLDAMITAVDDLLHGRFLDAFKEITAAAVALFGQMVTDSISIIGTIVSDLVSLFGGDGEKVWGIFKKIVDKVRDLFQWLYDELLGHSILWDMVDGFKAVFDKILEPINAVKDAIGAILDKGGALLDRILGKKNAAQTAEDLGNTWGETNKVIQDSLKIIRDGIDELIIRISGKGGLGPTFAKFATDFSVWASSISGDLSGTGPGNKSVLSAFNDVLDAIQGISDAISAPKSGLVDTISNMAKSGVAAIDKLHKAIDNDKPPGLIQIFDALRKSVEKFIDKLNDIPRKIVITVEYRQSGTPPAGAGGGTIPLPHGSPVPMQHGGLVPYTPGGRLALLAESGPELVVPLHDIGNLSGQTLIVQGPLVELNNAIMRSEDDIRELAERISTILGREYRSRTRYAF